ncbi:DUF881 domain-containing protein [Kamptonema cortianum]|nr:DUF881 domain-containing protein [Geitlerinema splendidum]MDK3158826.1 DUF881 domain-containing protein [Kamptonema cortianum]
MNPFKPRPVPQKWILPASLVALVVGLMVSIAFANQERSRLGFEGDFGEPASLNRAVSEEIRSLRDEVTKLRDEKSKLEDTLAEQGNASKDLNASLKEARMFAALTEVEGPGIIVTLSDSKKPMGEMFTADAGIIHFLDVLKVVNELFNAGAEAIAVNGRRVGPQTDFRCVGTTILVDTDKIASPIEIKAIGETQTLLGAINMPGGVLEELRDVDPGMVKVEPADMLFLKPYDGILKFKSARVPEPAATP